MLYRPMLLLPLLLTISCGGGGSDAAKTQTATVDMTIGPADTRLFKGYDRDTVLFTINDDTRLNRVNGGPPFAQDGNIVGKEGVSLYLFCGTLMPESNMKQNKRLGVVSVLSEYRSIGSNNPGCKTKLIVEDLDAAHKVSEDDDQSIIWCWKSSCDDLQLGEVQKAFGTMLTVTLKK